MPLTVCVLASGSSGNCTFVSTGTTHVLIDAGLSCKQIELRLAQINIDPGTVNALCLTHEHTDHTGALRVLHRKYGVPLYGNSGTIEATERMQKTGPLPWNIFESGQTFSVGEMEISPFSVPHDAYDPVGFIIRHQASCLGVVTDMGTPTSLIRERLRDCQGIVVEANHDEEMLKDSRRPWSLKQRIAGRQGHLSNTQAGEMLAELAGPHTQTVFLAHLSKECNHPELAEKSVRKLLDRSGHTHVALKMTYPDRVSEMITVGEA